MKTNYFCIIVCCVSCLLTMHLDVFASNEDDINIDLPPVVITCSKSTNDGIGRCYFNTGYPWAISCEFSGYQTHFCTTTYYV